MLWPVEAVLPACAGVQYDALVEPWLGCRRRACAFDDADTICKKRYAKGGAGVEVLADKEVAVVEGGCCEGYDGLR